MHFNSTLYVNLGVKSVKVHHTPLQHTLKVKSVGDGTIKSQIHADSHLNYQVYTSYQGDSYEYFYGLIQSLQRLLWHPSKVGDIDK